MAFVLAVGCGYDGSSAPAPSPDPLLLSGDLLIPVQRDLSATALQQRRARLQQRGPVKGSIGNEDFYLAIRRSKLAEKWFLSAYLKELQPYGPYPISLGTLVVRFREQNGKLYVFDADRRRATSDAFNPDLILDAYPIVTNARFAQAAHADDYVLIDPAAGLNRFGALSNLFASGSGAVQLATELSFVQKFKRFADGGSFEQIVTTYASDPIGLPNDVDANDLRMTATLGISVRTYAETAGFARVPRPARPHYFLSAPYRVTNTGVTAQDPVHWPLHPGMAPIVWHISPQLAELAARPEYGGAT
ncbi:MAG: hypothetical protein HC863_01530 [Myxococcales bacterium]|nr:hypothetical protein [Myxococcales bacterium]